MKASHKKNLILIEKRINKIRKVLSDMSWDDGVDEHYQDFQYFSGLLLELQDKFKHLTDEAKRIN